MCVCLLFFFSDSADAQIYTLSLHDALPIFAVREVDELDDPVDHRVAERDDRVHAAERDAVDELLDEGVHGGVSKRPADCRLSAPGRARAGQKNGARESRAPSRFSSEELYFF